MLGFKGSTLRAMTSVLAATPWPIALFGVLVVFVAAAVRGYAGFGFSALCVASLSFVMPMSSLVPVILMMEVAASVLLLPSIWPDIRWRFVLGLTLSSAIATPLGIAALQHLPAQLVLAMVLLVIVLACALLMRGFQLSGEQPVWRIGVVGFVAGAVNAAGAVGGLIYSLFLMADGMPPRAFRASLAMLFLLVDLVATLMMTQAGLATTYHLSLLAVLLVPLALGLMIGSRLFSSASPEGFKRFVLSLLLMIALSGMAKAIYDYQIFF